MCNDKTCWPDCWWDSRNFVDHVFYGNIAKFVIAVEAGIPSDKVEAQQLVEYLAVKNFLPCNRYSKRLCKQKITSFRGALEFLQKRYNRTWEMLIEMTCNLYLLNCGDSRAEAYVLSYADFDSKRKQIEKELTRRAEIEDAVLIARGKEHTALEVERMAAAEKAKRVSQSRQERADMKVRVIMARETELATRTNKKRLDKMDGVVANPARDLASKAISIEQAKQHEHDLQEREKQRVAQLENMMEIVRIGDAIQRGDDAGKIRAASGF
jgi:hypothetical protein